MPSYSNVCKRRMEWKVIPFFGFYVIVSVFDLLESVAHHVSKTRGHESAPGPRTGAKRVEIAIFQ
jgi:hypothetical protein